MAKDPGFLQFSTLYREARYDEALAALDPLFDRFPDAPELRWHRANCLEQLERYAEIKPELDLLLARKPDYVPAIVMRVKYAQADDHAADDDELSDAERERREEEARARQHQHSLDAEAELRRALALDAKHVDALALLADVLRYRDDGAANKAEADALLDRAIELAPMRADLFETRARARQSAAFRDGDAPDCGIRGMSITDSGVSRSAVPVEADHRFRCKPITDSGRSRSVFGRCRNTARRPLSR